MIPISVRLGKSITNMTAADIDEYAKKLPHASDNWTKYYDKNGLWDYGGYNTKEREKYNVHEDGTVSKNPNISGDEERLMQLQYATAAMNALSHGITAYFGVKSRESAYGFKATWSRAKADTARLNAKLANQQVYNDYRMGENEAMRQGLAYGQKMASTRASQAGSGVRMSSASFQDVRASEWLAKEQDRISLQQTTVSKANEDKLRRANYEANAIVEDANAASYAYQARRQGNPWLQGAISLIGSLGTSLAGIWGDKTADANAAENVMNNWNN